MLKIIYILIIIFIICTIIYYVTVDKCDNTKKAKNFNTDLNNTVKENINMDKKVDDNYDIFLKHLDSYRINGKMEYGNYPSSNEQPINMPQFNDVYESTLSKKCNKI